MSSQSATPTSVLKRDMRKAGLPSPYVLGLNNGRLHDMVVEEVNDHFLVGRVASLRSVCLYEQARTTNLSLKVDTPKVIQETCYAGQNTVFVDEACFFRTEQCMGVRIGEIALWERSARPYFNRPLYRANGEMDEDLLLQVLPVLRHYRIPGRGFVSNPAVAAVVPTGGDAAEEESSVEEEGM
jgi:hypothetical protein